MTALPLFLALFPLLPAATDTNEPSFRQSVLHVLVTYQEQDPVLPWRKQQPGMRHGYAVVVDPTHAITTETLVRSATLVEVLRSESGDKISASVPWRDDQANLALLTIERTGDSAISSLQEAFSAPPADSSPLVPVSVADRLSRKAHLTVVQFDDTGQIQHGAAEITQIYVGNLALNLSQSLIAKVLTDVNISGEGAPAFLDGRLAGLVMSYDRGSRTGEMLPFGVIDHFLKDIAQPPYEGFASAGFAWAPLIDPAKRAYLQVREPNRGILVLRALPGSGESDALRPMDVILEWDGYPIDNLGFYEDPDFGRLAMPYLVRGRRKPGDVVPVRLIRDRASVVVRVPLRRLLDETALIPENVGDKPEEYLVEGGLIFRELTGRYIRAHGASWYQMLDPRLVHLYFTRRYVPEQKGDRVVLLSGVLPDPVNIGYQHLRDAIVTAVNGRPIRNLRDLFSVAVADRRIERIALRSFGIELAFDPRELPEANARIARLYRIPQLRRQNTPPGPDSNP